MTGGMGGRSLSTFMCIRVVDSIHGTQVVECSKGYSNCVDEVNDIPGGDNWRSQLKGTKKRARNVNLLLY